MSIRRLLYFLALLLLFGGLNRAEQKPTASFWREQKNDLVVLNFSPEFPILNKLDQHILSYVVQKKAVVVGVNLKQSESGTKFSFLCKRKDDPHVKSVISVIKEAVKEFVRIREIPPPKDDDCPSITPTRAPARVVFYLIT